MEAVFQTRILSVLKTQSIIIKPCTQEQVTDLQLHHNITFPAVYVDFLLTMGQSAPGFMTGDDCFYKHLGRLKEAAIELVKENNFIPLPEDAFVFWMHQGYQFAYFTEGTAADPVVYYFGEGENLKDYCIEGTLTDFYEIMLKVSGLIV